jgi:cardiolipin synthase
LSAGVISLLQDPAAEPFDHRLTVLIALVGELISILFVLRTIATGKSTAATLSWSMFILLFPYVGLLFYYVMPRQIQLRRLRRFSNRIGWIGPTLDRLVQPSVPGAAIGDPLLKMLARIDQDSVQAGNRVRLLESAQEFLDAAREAIAGAREYVHLQTYILRPDHAGVQFLEFMTDAARRGIEVRLLYDNFGSLWLRAKHLQAFHEAGGKSTAFAPLLWRRRWMNLNLRNHRKLLVVDGRIAFLGGRNIGEEYFSGRFSGRFKWHDAMVSVEGPAVTRLHRTFVEDWFNASDEDLCDKRYFPPQPRCGDEVVGVVQGGPDTRASLTHWSVLELINRAQDRLAINSPYLIPHPAVMTALQMASARGVRVTIQTNGRQAENPILYRAQRSYVREFLRDGIAVHETAGDYNHTKLILVDNHYLFCGSGNLDIRSNELNFELGIVVADSPLQEQARAMLARRSEGGIWLEIEHLPHGRLVRLVEGFCRLLSPLL